MNNCQRCLVLGGMVALFLLLVNGTFAKTVNRIVAVVNGEIITMYDLQKEMGNPLLQRQNQQLQSRQGSAAQKKKVLTSMVNHELFEQEAKRLEITVSDVEVENQIDQIMKERDLSKQELEESLEQSGMTMKGFKEKLRQDIKINRLLSSMVRQKVVVSDEEIKAFYEKHKEQYVTPKRLHIRIILHSSQQKLRALKQRIEQGEISFAEAARKHSRGPGAEQGGDLGLVNWKDLGSTWKEQIEPLNPGDLSRVFSTQGNAALLKLESLQSSSSQQLSKVRDEIRQKIFSKKLKQRYQEYVQELRSKAVVEVRL